MRFFDEAKIEVIAGDGRGATIAAMPLAERMYGL